MTVYMLRYGDKWYIRRGGCWGHWGEQQRAAVWSTKQGPASAKGSVPESQRVNCEIVEFRLEKHVRL